MNTNSVTTPNFVNSQISSNDVIVTDLSKVSEYFYPFTTGRGIYTAYMWPYDNDANSIERITSSITFYIDPGVGYQILQEHYGLDSSITPIIGLLGNNFIRFIGNSGAGWYYYLIQKICNLNLT